MIFNRVPEAKRRRHVLNFGVKVQSRGREASHWGHTRHGQEFPPWPGGARLITRGETQMYESLILVE